MPELYHVGVHDDAVPESVVLVDSDLLADPSVLPGWEGLGGHREYVNGTVRDVLVCGGAYGAPPVVIALEELARAGARRIVCLSRCCCSACAAGGQHPVVVATGAVRDERISFDYAPPEFPAVPAAEILAMLRSALPDAVADVVRTVDLVVEPLAATPAAAVDLLSSAVLVVGAASGMRVGAVVVGAAAGDRQVAALVAAVIDALRPRPAEGEAR